MMRPATDTLQTRHPHAPGPLASRRHLLSAAAALALFTLGGCASYQVGDTRTQLPADVVPATLSAAGADAASAPTAAATAQAAPAWREVVTDPRLVKVVEAALAHNRDLKLAALNVDAARASYRITDAALLPEVDASGGASRTRTSAATSGGTASLSRETSVSLGISSWEIDLWGRLRDLKASALASYLSLQQTRDSVQASVVTETVQAWLTLAADRELARLYQETLQGNTDTLELTQRKLRLGAASALDVATAQASVQTARANLANAQSQVDQDRHALQLLMGTGLDEALMPTDHEDGQSTVLPQVPADLPSSVLLRRPDVRAAERDLQAAEADVSAARAALLPTISLTSSVGQASTSLNDLMAAGNRTWAIAPSISLPIFDGGSARASLDKAQVSQRIALTTYEKTLQTAFQEAADALSIRARLSERLAAQTAQVEAYQQVLTLTEKQRELGATTALSVLTAQLNLYSAQQTLISLRLTEQSNRLTLYKVLGGV